MLSIIISPITGKWIDKKGVKQPLTAGSFLLIVGVVVLRLFLLGRLIRKWACDFLFQD
jgi:hypothetical protein